jgi:hypothetical protein
LCLSEMSMNLEYIYLVSGSVYLYTLDE